VLKHDAEGVQAVVGSLSSPLKSQAGRNNMGRITVRHQGSGNKRMYRIVDFSNPIEDKKAKVIGIQYDPNRTAAIALLEYEDDKKAYTLAVKGMHVDDVVETTRERALDIKPGNRMCIKYIPAGILVSNIELEPGKRAKVVRSAGSSAVVLSIEDNFVSVKMPSSEIRKFRGDCLATVGQVGNEEWSLVRHGKAGRMRRRGIRPTVRGKVMNPVDHPHGGGEGSNPIGLKHPKTPWGKPALGVPTRRAHKSSDTLIVRRRKRKK
jgi:large subunit ribosomal protein L2